MLICFLLIGLLASGPRSHFSNKIYVLLFVGLLLMNIVGFAFKIDSLGLFLVTTRIDFLRVITIFIINIGIIVQAFNGQNKGLSSAALIGAMVALSLYESPLQVGMLVFFLTYLKLYQLIGPIDYKSIFKKALITIILIWLTSLKITGKENGDLVTLFAMGISSILLISFLMNVFVYKSEKDLLFFICLHVLVEANNLPTIFAHFWSVIVLISVILFLLIDLSKIKSIINGRFATRLCMCYREKFKDKLIYKSAQIEAEYEKNLIRYDSLWGDPDHKFYIIFIIIIFIMAYIGLGVSL